MTLEPGETVIRAYVRKAITLGLTRIEIPLPESRPVVFPTSLDEALSRYPVIIGRPVEKMSQVDQGEYGIETFYKIQIINVLYSEGHRKPCCGDLIKIPNQAEPSTGEICLYTPGGTVTVDGIEIRQRIWTGELTIGQDYLLFLSQDLSEKVNMIYLGKEVIYKVDQNGLIDTSSVEPNAITRDISSKCGNSVDSLKSYIKNSRN
ncbi:MAG: hypothetical protein J2P41_07920 [Blastocatellia bacterium]|nr:hypothetical protein [Blastocatellia bacterium]